MLNPDNAQETADRFAEELRQRALAAREGLQVLGESPPLDPDAALRIEDHQLPYWTERMAVAYLKSREAEGSRAIRNGTGYDLHWPDGEIHENAVFLREEAEEGRVAHLSLEEAKVRDLVLRLPNFAPGQSVPAIELPGISEKVSGIWSLWRISLETTEGRELRVLPVFLSDEGRVLGPTARAIWDRMIEMEWESDTPALESIVGEEAISAYEKSRAAAEEHGTALYHELLATHAERLERERAKMEHAIAARRRAIERVGLLQVRRHRLAQLERERVEWEERIEARRHAGPELAAGALVRIERAGGGRGVPRRGQGAGGGGGADGGAAARGPRARGGCAGPERPRGGWAMSASSSAGGGWRQPILSLFTPEAAAAFRLTIVSDPDQLLTEQTILEEIERRGFDLIPFDDAIAFRYAYESQYLRHWDHDRPTAMVVLLRTELDDPDTLPYDLLSSARRNDRVFRAELRR